LLNGNGGSGGDDESDPEPRAEQKYHHSKNNSLCNGNIIVNNYPIDTDNEEYADETYNGGILPTEPKIYINGYKQHNNKIEIYEEDSIMMHMNGDNSFHELYSPSIEPTRSSSTPSTTPPPPSTTPPPLITPPADAPAVDLHREIENELKMKRELSSKSKIADIIRIDQDNNICVVVIKNGDDCDTEEEYMENEKLLTENGDGADEGDDEEDLFSKLKQRGW
jgi:hypothetical protein